MQALAKRPLLVDAALAVAFIAAAEAEAALGLATRDAWVHALLAPVFLAPLAFRRRLPLLAFGAAVAGLVVLDANAALSLFGAAIVGSYSVGSVVEGRATYVAPATAGLLFAGMVVDGEAVPSDLIAFGVFFVGPWWVGRIVRGRARQAAELVRLAELERDRRSETAVAEERARIARELHDIVSHSISVVTIQAQAVRRRLGPEQQREIDDLRAVEATARQAMAEMRRLFGVLRADDRPASLSPQPGLDQLGRLVEGTRAAGLDVALAVEGDASPLPPGVDLAAYRIVQEALTNALRHGRGDRAEVCLRYEDASLEITVVDDGRGGAPGRGGHGLVGMRERVALYGGTLDVGAREGGGFRVRALLPVREATA
jgi:signal transduction histidine kinase